MAIMIKVEKNKEVIATFPLTKSATIGRDLKSQIVVDDPEISRTHCRLEITNANQVMFIDLQSKNGSFLNSNRITAHPLKINDKIKIGTLTIYIDETQLTILEKKGIGVGPISPNAKNLLTLPALIIKK